MKKMLFVLLASLVGAAGAFAADMTIDAKFDLSGKNTASNYLSVKGSLFTLDKAHYDADLKAKAAADPALVDAISGATEEATAKWNAYRSDVKGKNTLPGAFNHLLKYGVSPEAQYQADLPKAWKNADGSITIQFVHRGTALKLTTDAAGKFNFPVGDYKTRKIGLITEAGVNIIHPDFSKDGTVAGVDWAKVWDPATPDGKVINNVPAQKTTKIVDDKGASTFYLWTGALQVTLDGTVVTVKGDLNAEAVK